jgi:hypothetical protein
MTGAQARSAGAPIEVTQVWMLERLGPRVAQWDGVMPPDVAPSGH